MTTRKAQRAYDRQEPENTGRRLWSCDTDEPVTLVDHIKLFVAGNDGDRWAELLGRHSAIAWRSTAQDEYDYGSMLSIMLGHCAALDFCDTEEPTGFDVLFNGD